jgi:hypothetical protein
MRARGFIVWGAGIVLVLGAFLIFAAVGWPGDVNSCTHPDNPTPEKPNTCYCESFSPSDLAPGTSGVRQPQNTWFNLYAIATSLIVALFVFIDRGSTYVPNPMRGSNSWFADIYIFAVLFLGLGSMWFHASLREWGGVFDQLSMFVYTGFLVFYSVRRLWDSDLFFAIAYPATVVLFTVIAANWTWEFASLILIVVLVLAYLIFEVLIWRRDGKVMQGKLYTKVLWCLAVFFIIAATIFWALSQTGAALCDPGGLQPHALIWHPFAGIMAVLLYFYWRDENVA